VRVGEALLRKFLSLSGLTATTEAIRSDGRGRGARTEGCRDYVVSVVVKRIKFREEGQVR